MADVRLEVGPFSDWTVAERLAELTVALEENTEAVGRGSAAQGVGKAMEERLGTLGVLSPVVTGILRLFGGGGEEKTEEALAVYERPEAVRFDLPVRRTEAGPPAVYPQVTVQVQAMDSRSFMDHSDEIARAVRAAMLESNSLNDVVGEI